MNTKQSEPNTEKGHKTRVTFTKFDQNIPEDFLLSRFTEINWHIDRLNNDICLC